MLYLGPGFFTEHAITVLLVGEYYIPIFWHTSEVVFLDNKASFWWSNRSDIIETGVDFVQDLPYFAPCWSLSKGSMKTRAMPHLGLHRLKPTASSLLQRICLPSFRVATSNLKSTTVILCGATPPIILERVPKSSDYTAWIPNLLMKSPFRSHTGLKITQDNEC